MIENTKFKQTLITHCKVLEEIKKHNGNLKHVNIPHRPLFRALCAEGMMKRQRSFFNVVKKTKGGKIDCEASFCYFAEEVVFSDYVKRFMGIFYQVSTMYLGIFIYIVCDHIAEKKEFLILKLLSMMIACTISYILLAILIFGQFVYQWLIACTRGVKRKIREIKIFNNI